MTASSNALNRPPSRTNSFSTHGRAAYRDSKKLTIAPAPADVTHSATPPKVPYNIPAVTHVALAAPGITPKLAMSTLNIKNFTGFFT